MKTVWIRKGLLAVALLLTFAAEAASEGKPNVVFLMADDLGYGDPGCYGGTTIATPNIDRLAREGIRFTQAYSGGCVCTPARCVLMTGMHNGHAAARDNVPHYHTYLTEKDVTIAEILKSQGYRCGGVGKWSLGDAGTEGRAMNQGFDSWFGYLNQDHAHYYYPEYLDDDEGRLELKGNGATRRRYSHDLMTERALRFIRESKAGPFFFYGAFALPHFAARDEDPHGFTVPSTAPFSDRAWDERSKKYASMVHMIDRDVGRIVDLIDQLGLKEQTLVIFTSDNGGHKTIHDRFKTSGPLRGFKRTLYEGGIRVPFIARWPGLVPAGITSDAIIAFQDMLPTFAALAGVTPTVQARGSEIRFNTTSTSVDGINVIDSLKGGPTPENRGRLYWDYGHCRGKQYTQAVRLGDWKGIRNSGSVMELYDLATDPGETTNLSASRPDIVAKISTIMSQAAEPNSRYKIGKVYRGKAIWNKADVRVRPFFDPSPRPTQQKISPLRVFEPLRPKNHGQGNEENFAFSSFLSLGYSRCLNFGQSSVSSSFLPFGF